MKKQIVAMLVGSLLLAGCTTDPYTGESKVSKAAIGAGVGAVLGAAVSSKKDRAKGAAIGAALGGGTGVYFDRQEAKLRETLNNTGVSVTRTPEGIKLNMPGAISFPSNQSGLMPSFYPVLESVALVLKEFNNTAIKVSGHTDSTGGAELNQRLSEQRAESVAAFLSGQGVARARMQVYGYGPRYPVADNKSEAGKAANRRVEIDILNP
ncbi:Putative outer membrane protein [gamma proteobacterium HdN1]|nr:Putative outer membrane protein [gamma proteobacterium HdN1]